MHMLRSVGDQAAENGIPLLANGDRLTVGEFLRRYEALPDLKKAELIEGVVYMGSPVSCDHGQPDNLVQSWLGYYQAHTVGTAAYGNTTLVLESGENCAQPDGCLRIVQECGGLSHINAQRYLQGPVELAAEISISSVSYDLHDKLRAYERNGVGEYLVWRVEDEALDWFCLRRGGYRRLALRRGVFESKRFPGLWLDMAAMLQRDLAKVLKTLDAGLASEEHQRFVERLTKRRTRR